MQSAMGQKPENLSKEAMLPSVACVHINDFGVIDPTESKFSLPYLPGEMGEGLSVCDVVYLHHLGPPLIRRTVPSSLGSFHFKKDFIYLFLAALGLH